MCVCVERGERHILRKFEMIYTCTHTLDSVKVASTETMRTRCPVHHSQVFHSVFSETRRFPEPQTNHLNQEVHLVTSLPSKQASDPIQVIPYSNLVLNGKTIQFRITCASRIS